MKLVTLPFRWAAAIPVTMTERRTRFVGERQRARSKMRGGLNLKSIRKTACTGALTIAWSQYPIPRYPENVFCYLELYIDHKRVCPVVRVSDTPLLRDPLRRPRERHCRISYVSLCGRDPGLSCSVLQRHGSGSMGTRDLEECYAKRRIIPEHDSMAGSETHIIEHLAWRMHRIGQRECRGAF